MSPVLFTYLLWVMSFLAIVVFICLYFITAGYGQFRTKRWGYSIDNRVAWFLMEAPVFFVMLIIWCRAGFPFHLPELILLGLLLVHYFQRSFVFPSLMKGHSRMPLSIMMIGILFNVINGIMQGGGLFWFPITAYTQGASYLLRWNAIVGIIVFLFGMIVNWHSDYVIRHLRQPGETRHYLPQAGFYRYVTSANYFGELVEWIGFAIAAANPAAWVFALWTGANLIPRAHAIHRKYHEEFGDEAVGTRRRIIPLVY